MTRANLTIGIAVLLGSILGCEGGNISHMEDVSYEEGGCIGVPQESIVAPLSCAMLNYSLLPDNDPQRTSVLKEIEDQFLQSQVGVAVEIPEGTDQYFVTSAERSASVAYASGPNGEKWLQIYADPSVFIQNYGHKFEVSATISGADAIRTMLSNPDADGLQINNALTERSLVLDKESLAALADRIGLQD